MNKMFCKGLSVIIAVMIAVGCMVFSSATAVKYGDLNNDGSVNSADALAILKHSVGSALLADEEKVLADVNADAAVNSADALLILQLSVGKISSFPVDGDSVPRTKSEILTCYTQAVDKAREDNPGYKLVTSSEVTEVDLSGSMLSIMSKEDIENQKKSMMQKQTRSNLLEKGSKTALSNLPAACTVTDPSVFKDITCTVLDDGNYKIDIKFKDEKNPTKDSVVVETLGLLDMQTVTKQMEDEFNAELGAVPEADKLPAKMVLEIPTLEYKNCAVSCVINAETGELISYSMTADMSTSVVMKAVIDLGFITETISDMTTDTVTRTTFAYSNFVY